jgi:hypothetical protein
MDCIYREPNGGDGNYENAQRKKTKKLEFALPWRSESDDERNGEDDEHDIRYNV